MKASKNLITFLTSFLLVFFLISCGKKTDNNPTPTKSSAKTITSFTVAGNNLSLTGTIGSNTVTLTAPAGSDVTALVPTISVSPNATISPASGVAQDFSKSVTYTVTAEDGSKQVYTATLTLGKSGAKAILTFAFNGLTPAVSGTISEDAKTIKATVPAGTAVTALVPTITASAKATVSPASGTATDFTKSVVYTVTAEDGTKQAYTVSVTVAALQPIVLDCNTVLPTTLVDRGPGVDYIVKCNINITQKTVIEPGVNIQFDGKTSGFTVGLDGSLYMVGTAAKPIILDGTTAAAGAWAGILYNSCRDILNNQWQYVTVTHAGGGQYTAGLIINNSGDYRMGLSLQNCTFSNNLGDGLAEVDKQDPLISTFSAFSHNTFTGNTMSPMQIKLNEMNSLDDASSYSGNGLDYIDVYQSTVLRINTTISKMNVPYRVLNYISLNQKVTVKPGVTIAFAQDAGIYISYLNLDGSFNAVGTASQPIHLIGAQANTKGYWAGLEFDNTDPQIALAYCAIDGAGSIPSGSNCSVNQKAAVSFGGRCGYSGGANNGLGSVTHCTISNSGGYGIAYRTGHAVVTTDDAFSGNTLDNIFTY